MPAKRSSPKNGSDRAKGGRPAGAGSHRQWLQVRIDDGLDTQLDEVVEKLQGQGIKATRSSVTRELLWAALLDKGAVAVAGGNLRQIQQTSQRVIRSVLEDAFKQLPDRVPAYLERELQQST